MATCYRHVQAATRALGQGVSKVRSEVLASLVHTVGTCRCALSIDEEGLPPAWPLPNDPQPREYAYVGVGYRAAEWHIRIFIIVFICS